MEPAHDGLQYAALPGEYQHCRPYPGEGGLFDIFRSIWGTPRADTTTRWETLSISSENPSPAGAGSA